MELGEILNMTRVHDGLKFPVWTRKYKVDIKTRSYGLWNGA